MTSNQKSEELLPPQAADCASGVRLTKSEEIRIINRRGRSTHHEEKTVLRSGGTPEIAIELAGSHSMRIRGQMDRATFTRAIDALLRA
jgi:hypothetical protein